MDDGNETRAIAVLKSHSRRAHAVVAACCGGGVQLVGDGLGRERDCTRVLVKKTRPNNATLVKNIDMLAVELYDLLGWAYVMAYGRVR